MQFFDQKEGILTDLKNKAVMALATSTDNKTTVRNMSVIIYNDRIYFQTDSKMEKVEQINSNNNVALCVDSYQIQGIANILGTWDDNKEILAEYIKKHEDSYEKYKIMADEIVIEVEIVKIKKWEYKMGKPYIIEIDFRDKKYCEKEYLIE